MSQAEITIPDGTGLEVEQRIRAAFEAVVTDFSGSTPPATTYPIMRWADTANNVLKIRNLANDGWIGFMDLATGEVLTNAATAANALNATNVTTNINGHAIVDIFEADGVTIKEATHAGSAESAVTGPPPSAGFYYFVHEAPFAGIAILNNMFYSTQSVGPTGSGTSLIWTELDSLPSNIKGIRIGIFLQLQSNDSNFQTAAVKVRKYNSETPFGEIAYCCAASLLVKGEEHYQQACNIADVPVDSNKRFQLNNFCSGVVSGKFPICRIYLEGYYI